MSQMGRHSHNGAGLLAMALLLVLGASACQLIAEFDRDKIGGDDQDAAVDGGADAAHDAGQDAAQDAAQDASTDSDVPDTMPPPTDGGADGG